MKTLWVFGDSHTEGHGCTNAFEYYQQYYKEGDKIWCEHLAQHLKTNVINKGTNGASNDMILDSIVDSVDEIKSDDIVIIGKTYSNRFDVPQQSGLNPVFLDWLKVDLDENNSQFTLEQQRCIIDFRYYFMESPLFDERWNKRWEFVQKVLENMGCKVIVWDVMKELKGIHTIKQATNAKINDGHMSFQGHLDFSYHMFNKWFKDQFSI